MAGSLDAIHEGRQQRAHIARLLDSIVPAVIGIGSTLAPEEQLQLAVEANVRWAMRQILATPEAKARADEGANETDWPAYEKATRRVSARLRCRWRKWATVLPAPALAAFLVGDRRNLSKSDWT